MNVASLELCKELYELSGWFHPTPGSSDCASYTWIKKKHTTVGYCLSRDEAMKQMLNVGIGKLTYYIPGYDLGYLLRKLPAWIEPEKNIPHLLTVQPNPIGKGWNALYRLSVATPTSDRRHAAEIHVADTPEDATCKLAIELFKQGVLKKESKS